MVEVGDWLQGESQGRQAQPGEAATEGRDKRKAMTRTETDTEPDQRQEKRPRRRGVRFSEEIQTEEITYQCGG